MCDGRLDTAYTAEEIALCRAAEENPIVFERMRQALDLQWVLAHNRGGPNRDPHRPRAFDYLDVHPEWALVHWDTASLLYVRREGGNAQLAETDGYRWLRPHDLLPSLAAGLTAASANPRAGFELEGEVRRLLDAAPGDYRAHAVVLLYLDALGQHDDPRFAGR
jgi:hypothetical protein